jgi:hypothetical protein
MKEAVGNANAALCLWSADAIDLPRATPLDELRERPDVVEELASGGIPIHIAPDLGNGNRHDRSKSED